MKKAVSFLTIFFIVFSVAAKETVAGYLVFSANDTMWCKIKVPKDLDLFTEVSVIDSFGKKATFRPQDHEIKSFGFNYENEKYIYTARTDEHGVTDFFMIKTLGSKLNLYYRYTFNGSGSGASYRSDIFMLEDANNKQVTVVGGLFSAYKKKIKTFLKDDPILLEMFDKKVLAITDIPDFVVEANKLQ